MTSLIVFWHRLWSAALGTSTNRCFGSVKIFSCDAKLEISDLISSYLRYADRHNLSQLISNLARESRNSCCQSQQPTSSNVTVVNCHDMRAANLCAIPAS